MAAFLEECRSQKAAQQQNTWKWIESITFLEECCSQKVMEEGPMVGRLNVGLNVAMEGQLTERLRHSVLKLGTECLNQVVRPRSRILFEH